MEFVVKKKDPKTAARTGRLEIDWSALGNPTSVTDLLTGTTIPTGETLSLPPVSGIVLQLH